MAEPAAVPTEPGPPDRAEPYQDMRPVLSPDVIAAAVLRSGIIGDRSGSLKTAIERVHFSGSRPPVIQCRVGTAEVGERMLFAEFVGSSAASHAASECERLSKHGCRQLPKGASADVRADAETGLVFRHPGLDARLPGLRLLRRPDEAADMLSRLLGQRISTGSFAVRLRAHRLGKRAVLEMQTDGDAAKRVFLRLKPASNDAGKRARDRHESIVAALRHQNAIAVPRIIGFDDALGLTAISALDGKPLSFADDGSYGARRAVAALAAFQSMDWEAGPYYGPHQEIALLETWVQRTSTFFDGLADPLVRALEALRSDLGALPRTPAGPCHRDFHERQLLLGAGTCGLIDFDTAVLADPMLDAGNLLAHARLSGLRTSGRHEDVDSVIRQWAHSAWGPDVARRLEIWTRSAHLRLACINAFSSEWRTVATALVAETR